MFCIAGFLVYKNFIKYDGAQYIPPKSFETDQIYTKFDLDILEDEFFKQLKQAKKINVLNLDKSEIGRQNPFIKF